MDHDNDETVDEILHSNGDCQQESYTTDGNSNSVEMKSKNGEGDSTDSRKFFGFPRESPSRGITLPTSPQSRYYKMDHKNRGKCLIFNNKNFELHTNLNERRGTEFDAQRLDVLFRALKFDVSKFENLRKQSMIEQVEKAAKLDYSNADCFVCCILTHGDLGVLFGTDGKFASDLIFSPFRGDACPTLVGKPKIFFIQACQGDRLDSGVTVYCDKADSSQAYRVPAHADFLIAYSTIPGFYSWRNTTQGSWFIQALCDVLEQHSGDEDLLSMLTEVCRKVAYDYESFVPTNAAMDHKKQVPCITSMLTRKVHFGSL